MMMKYEANSYDKRRNNSWSAPYHGNNRQHNQTNNKYHNSKRESTSYQWVGKPKMTVLIDAEPTVFVKPKLQWNTTTLNPYKVVENDYEKKRGTRPAKPVTAVKQVVITQVRVPYNHNADSHNNPEEDRHWTYIRNYWNRDHHVVVNNAEAEKSAARSKAGGKKYPLKKAWQQSRFHINGNWRSGEAALRKASENSKSAHGNAWSGNGRRTNPLLNQAVSPVEFAPTLFDSTEFPPLVSTNTPRVPLNSEWGKGQAKKALFMSKTLLRSIKESVARTWHINIHPVEYLPPRIDFPPSSTEGLEKYDDGDSSDDEECVMCGTINNYFHVNAQEIVSMQSGIDLRVERKLGWGAFSTVYLVTEHGLYKEPLNSFEDFNDRKFYAFKICRSGEPFFGAAKNEIEMLKRVKNSEFFVNLVIDMELDSNNAGRNQQTQWCVDMIHQSMLYDYVGPSLGSITQNGKLSLEGIYNVSSQLLNGLDYLHHTAGIIHRDIKVDNILVCAPPGYCAQLAKQSLWYKTHGNQTLPQAMISSQEYQQQKEMSFNMGSSKLPTHKCPIELPTHDINTCRIKISDMGIAIDNCAYTTDDHPTWAGTKRYKPPEAILHSGYDCRGDIWSAACLMFKLLTGMHLFELSVDNIGNTPLEDYHLILMQRMIGYFPTDVVDGGRMGRYFFKRHRLSDEYLVKKSFKRPPDQSRPLYALLTKHLEERDRPKWTMMPQFANVYNEFAKLLEQLFQLDFELRPTAAVALQHSFFRLAEGVIFSNDSFPANQQIDYGPTEVKRITSLELNLPRYNSHLTTPSHADMKEWADFEKCIEDSTIKHEMSKRSRRKQMRWKLQSACGNGSGQGPFIFDKQGAGEPYSENEKIYLK